MNRYTATGVLNDMRQGRRVIVLTATQQAARLAFEQVAAQAAADEKARRTNGCERITAANGTGWIAFGSTRGTQHRGTTADVVFLDSGCPDTPSMVAPIVAASPVGEVVRA